MTTNTIILSGVAQFTNLTSTATTTIQMRSPPNEASWSGVLLVILVVIVGAVAGNFISLSAFRFVKRHVASPASLSDFRTFLGAAAALRLALILLFVGLADGMYNCLPELDADKILAAGVALFLAAIGAKGKE